jgi:hypothetical protein
VNTLQAVQEGWRVLKPNGILCDIHPYNAFTPFTIATGEQELMLDVLDRSDAIEDVLIAQNALAIKVHEKFFTLEQQELFKTYRYWDSVEAARVFYDSEDSNACISPELDEKAGLMLKDAGDDAKISVQRLLLIGRYRKL